jgi:hypothetical protein
MAIAIYFNPASMDAQRYDETIRRLEQAGAGAPRGRTYHACFGSGDKLQVFDVWESQEAFDEFGKTLMPILQEVGIDPGQPYVEPIHNVIEG